MSQFIYSPTYDSIELRGSEEIRPWDIQYILRRFWKSGKIVLDVGCGTCAKTAWMAGESKEFIALDPSSVMRQAAQVRLSSVSHRIRVIDGTVENIPLPKASVSHLVSLMAPHHIAEFARVLSAGSLCILEALGELDKKALKDSFILDSEGRRGQLSGLARGERRMQIERELSDHFDLVLFSEGQWKSYFTRSQLELLLSQTNIIRDFSSKRDREVLDQFEQRYREERGILLHNHRYLFVARRR